MIITNLFISDYKILKDFSIKSNKESVSVFVGVNGSGKSSLLEAVALIFSQTYQFHIENKRTITAFSDFHIVYEIWPTTIIYEDAVSQNSRTDYQIVEIISDAKSNLKFDIKVNGEVPKAQKGEELKTALRRLLPANVIIYYSGLNDTMQQLCKVHEIYFSGLLQENRVEGLRPLFYFKPEHYKLLLLSLLSFEYGDVPSYISTFLKIDRLKSFAIRFKKPIWGKSSAENFWGAKGAVNTFLNLCSENATNITFDNDDNGILFEFNSSQSLFNIKDYYVEEKKFFQILDIALFDDLLDSIDITLIKNGIEIQAENLSEGEQQFITIKALNELLITPFTLLLFDEPDVFLHPQLQAQFISELIQYSDYACYFITTHSTILISNLKNGNLFLMNRGQIKKINDNYFGREYSDNLEDIMHTPGRNKESQDALNLIFDFIDKELFDDAKKNILDFENKYGKDDPEIYRANSLLNFLA